ncbi:MAG: ABC transporter ATP-binding protein [Candidatus Rokubacteria bacterium]|nr:ABC transporter ATP-binding protein [Candidatus Rokubacteria bacterium]
MPLLAVQDLSISFGGLAALAGVSFDVEAGEVAALIGPNGAGKTTVFNLLTGLYRPTRGRAMLDGEDLLGLVPHEIARRGVARTFQNTEVFRRLSVLDNVLVGQHTRLSGGLLGGLLGSPRVRREEAEARRRAETLLARVGLGDVADVDAASLPLGRQKRLEIARALALGPRLLLLDEPAGGLNPTETRELMRLIRGLRDEDGLAILVVEHNMELVMGISERVVVLHYGKRLAEGKPHEVARNPAVIEAYLGSGSGDADA